MSLSLMTENGSPNLLLIVPGIALVGYFLWKFFSAGSNSNPASFSTKLSNLSADFQAAVNFALDLVGSTPLPVQYNSASVNFTMSQIPIGTDFQGIAFASSDGSVNIYLTYYEYLIWSFATTDASHVATLSIPVRTLSNGVVTDAATGGYSITGMFPQLTINSLTGAVTPGIVDSTGAAVSLATLPTPPAGPSGSGQ